jgi:surfactin synthase thioesterase subunit
MFRPWAEGVAAGDVEVLAVLLPGHGRRIRERPYPAWEPLIDESFAALEEVLAGPHAFYGHSFGARLAYELAHVTQHKYPGATTRLFLSGSRSPDFPQQRPYMHEMDEAGFIDALRAMGSTPAEFLGHPQLRKLLLPAVHGEIRLAELWTDRHGGHTVQAPITAIHGREDPIDTAAAMRGWLAYSGPGGELIEVAGGHFFPDTHLTALLEVVNGRL